MPRTPNATLLVAAAVACAACSHARPHLDLSTTGARSGYLRTGRHEETVRLCHDFARAYANARCETIGETLQGRPIVALTIEKRRGLPAIVIEAGIHAGEIEGKDAGFAVLRDVLDGKLAPGVLDAASITFVPTINPDGHERFGPNNRPNQRGPEEMGFRTNGSRLNLNRDFVKADAPETRAMLGLLRTRDPVLFIDLHTTDGAKFQTDISVNVAPASPRPDQLDETARALSVVMQARLTTLGHLPVPFYPSFDVDTDPTSGFSVSEAPPRFTHFYAPTRGRMGMLVETHSWRTYKERVTSTYHTLQAVLEEATRSAPTWRRVADEADRADAALAGTSVPLVWAATDHVTMIDFRGYAYESRTSDLTGGVWVTYDESKPEVWHVPLHDVLAPTVTITAPRAGYVIDGGYARLLAPLLDVHGVQYEPIAGMPRIELEAYRATTVTYGESYESHQRPTLVGAWAPESRVLDQGAIFVPIAQPLARLVMHMMEPTLPDSFAAWGLLNTAFERKEYMEEYVAEAAARAMLAADPTLQAQFDAAVAAAPDVMKDPAKRLEFFYRRTPAWDERVNLVPIYRVARRP